MALTKDQMAFAEEIANEVTELIRKKISVIPECQVCNFIIALEDNLENKMDDLLDQHN